FGLAALAALGILGASLLGRRNIPFAPLALSALVVYLTAVHVALQAEPRYSVPYRPEEVLLAITALAVLGEWIVARIRKFPPDNAPWNSDSSRMPRRMLVG
ncbi:MAG TPA: hypothetical protein VFF05_04375, partial [Rudaea sp.]|nr:hypothetical protein [Rudaea sp.]